MSKLLMLVGMNIDDKRFEAGEKVDTGLLSERQIKFLTKEGYAEPLEKGEHVPADVTVPAAVGEFDPHETTVDIVVTDAAPGEGK